MEGLISEGLYNQNKNSASKQAIAAVLITDFYPSIYHLFARFLQIEFQTIITN